MSRILPWVRLFAGLKYSVIFFVVLVGLPFTAFAWAPLNLVLGGLFQELVPWDVFWISIAFFAASWTLMSTTGLLTDGLEERRPELGQGPFLPAAAARLLSVPITAGQMLLFSAAALVQAAVVVVEAEPGSRGLAAAAALAGAAGAYGVQTLLAVPAHLAVPDYAPIPRWRLVDAVWALFRPLKPLADGAYALASKLFALLRVRRERWPDHFYAATTATGTLVLLAAVGWLFFPPAVRFSVSPPAGAYLYLLLLLVIWVLSGLDFHLSRFNVSPILVVLAIMALVYRVTGIDHIYHAAAEAAGAAPLTPVEVARTSRAPDNLVVVASAGGGILAAGWTTLTLQHMLTERPALADEIRLLSGVSGGSVGAAYFAAALRGLPDAERTPAGLDQALAAAFRNSTTSSLDATAYGLALLDFERVFVDDALPVLRRWDRGLLLENSWERIAGVAPTLLELRGDVRAGRLPGLILNSTVMERGHRLMLTPIDFRGVGGVHAQTQTEFLGAGDREVDLGLWTAARLSATFPYVSPAARSSGLPATAAVEPATNRAYHLLDGGYYENFGVTSTFDWLWPVLEARRDAASGLTFRKVLIIRLNPFPPSGLPEPQPGLLAAVAGPLLGLANIRNGSQITRNATDLERDLGAWRALFAAEGLGVCLGDVEIRPPRGVPEGPLSWHLTASQIDALKASWATVVPQWERAREFLERPDCDQGAPLTPAPTLPATAP